MDEDAPGLAMSRSIGDTLVKDIGVIAEPEITSYSLTAMDKFLIIATDGVWEYIPNEKVDITFIVYNNNLIRR